MTAAYPMDETRLSFIEKIQTVYELSLETYCHPSSIHLVGDRWFIKRFFIKQTKTRRGIDILRRWWLNFNRSWKPVFHPTSYERSSQAQNLTVPPILLSAAGYLLIFAGWRAGLLRKSVELNRKCCRWCLFAVTCFKFELVSLSQSAIGDLGYEKPVYGRIG